MPPSPVSGPTTESPVTWWRRVWHKPEPRMSDAGFSGEMAIAGVRLLVVIILVYLPASAHIAAVRAGEAGGGRDIELLLATAAVGLIGALLVYSAVQRNWGRSWIGFASSILDVTLVSAILAVILVTGRPVAAIMGTLVFPVYFLSIAGTSLRYDSRVCLVTGALAVLQYGSLVAVAVVVFGVEEGTTGIAEVGIFQWDTQVVRVLALIGATVLAVTLVVRARELRTLSSRDRFTGLLNRATFDERLRQEVDFATSTRGNLAVAMVDIDHFKRFNDTYGHAGGDEALRRVSTVLQRSFRDTDAVARYGGEEFSVLLVGVGLRHTRPLFERIRQAIEALSIPVAGHPRPASVTVSIGVALWPRDGDTPEGLLAEADRRLYEAKQSGRNLVVGPPADG